MSGDGTQTFPNNWAYLKTELRWLDRLLMIAVSRQKQDYKVIDQVAQTEADRATSHWWKGIVAINQAPIYEDGPPPRQPSRPVNYSQELESRIRASRQAGVTLALPDLRDRLSLTPFEKNLILMAIAPEVNRRYGRLYQFLQDDEEILGDLPTVDLCLRLLCRNDQAWQAARSRLVAPDSLAERGLVEWLGEDGTLLSQQVKLTDGLINYLLSETPEPAALDHLLAEDATPPEEDLSWVSSTVTATTWEQLVLPQKLLHQLQGLSRQAVQRYASAEVSGLMVLLVGPPGTGKATAARAIAVDVGSSLACLDLETVAADNDADMLIEEISEPSAVFLVENGGHWLGRSRDRDLDPALVYQWWQRQQQTRGLTLVTTPHLHQIRPHWRQQFDAILHFPRPDAKARRQLWKQAVPEDIKVSGLSWSSVAKQLPLTGGEIATVAQTALLECRAAGRSTLTLTHLRRALELHYPHLKLEKAH